MTTTDIKSIFNPVLFWDAEQIDLKKNAGYIISRVLDFGDIEDVHALQKLYSADEIAHVIRTRRGISPKTGKFWAIKLGIPINEVACLRKSFPKAPYIRFLRVAEILTTKLP